MKRREFITVASSIPVVIAACSPKAAKQVANPPRADGFQRVGTVADLDKNGQILAEQVAGSNKVLVVRDPMNKSKIIAVKPTCTHAGCTVVWQQNQTAFVCPCHDSKFASDGKVQQGPADEPLATYVAKLEGDSILVKVG